MIGRKRRTSKMAAPKREHDAGGFDKKTDDSLKKFRQDEDTARTDFLTWCRDQNLVVSEKLGTLLSWVYSSGRPEEVFTDGTTIDRWSPLRTWANINAVTIGKSGSVHQYGMFAVKDIDEEEVLFEVPRHLLLGPQNCCISALLEKESECLESPSGWLPLLVGLMYEYTNPASKWHPYYTLVPDFNYLDLPMFWPRTEMQTLLQGTSVPEAVVRDIASLEKEFEDKVKPFVKRHSEVFTDARCQDLEFFKKMVAFVMAYSFTEPPPAEDDSDDEDQPKVSPVMVPMADILNHIAKNNAKLDFEEECLKMVASKEIKKGDEVFNTYGELPNWQLLQMYGFAERYPENHFDTVDIPMASVLNVTSQGLDDQQAALMKKKWQFLKSLDLVQDDGMYVVGLEGVLTEDEMYNTLKVMVMDESAFSEHQQKEGWSDAEEDDVEQGNMGYGDIEALPESWRHLLKRIVTHRMTQFLSSLDEDQKSLDEKSETWKSMTQRQKYAAYIRDGQRRLLQQLLDACSGR